MLIDSYPVEDVFARVPEVATQTDPVLKTLDSLPEDDQLYQAVRTDLGTRYRLTLMRYPRNNSGKIWRLEKEGERILARQGYSLPSLIR